MSGKPKFVFLGMDTCGHCVNFKSKPSVETSPWAQLLRDKELQSKVDFVFIKHGFVKNEKGVTERRPLSGMYDHVQYGPFFQLQSPDYSDNKAKDTFVEMKGVVRNKNAIKKWILATLQQKPRLLQSLKKPADPVKARKPVRAPTKVRAPISPKTKRAVVRKAPPVSKDNKFSRGNASKSNAVIVPEQPVVLNTRKFVHRNARN